MMTNDKSPTPAVQGTKPTLEELLESARKHVMTPEEIEAQRQSWVKGEMGISAAERAEGRHTTLMKPLAPSDSEGTKPDTRKVEGDMHWTARSDDDLMFSVLSDFTASLEMKLENDGISQEAFAAKAGVTAGRISQLLNDPTNLEIRTILKYAKVLGMKVAILAYEDGDPEGKLGPISAAIFEACWKNLGSPRDLFGLDKAPSLSCNGGLAAPSLNSVDTPAPVPPLTIEPERIPELERIRGEMMRRFSDKLSMEEIASCAWALAAPVPEPEPNTQVWPVEDLRREMYANKFVFTPELGKCDMVGDLPAENSGIIPCVNWKKAEPPARKDELGTPGKWAAQMAVIHPCGHTEAQHLYHLEEELNLQPCPVVAPQASPEHDLRKQDTPESKEHWDFVAEATARVEAMPEWKKNSVAVGGSPEAPAKDERFKIIVCGFDELPPEVDRDDLSNNGSGSDYASYLLVYLDGKLLRCESSAMEPEDVSFYRDLRWISQAIIEAWEAGKRARLGLSGRAE